MKPYCSITLANCGIAKPACLLVKSTLVEFSFMTHRIHGAAIYGNIYYQYTPNVSIYIYMDPMGDVVKITSFVV